VVATGGLAPLFAEGTPLLEKIDPDLTLEGLRLLAERNPMPSFEPDGGRSSHDLSHRKDKPRRERLPLG
jgi:type III pantothenate kinase